MNEWAFIFLIIIARGEGRIYFLTQSLIDDLTLSAHQSVSGRFVKRLSLCFSFLKYTCMLNEGHTKEKENDDATVNPSYESTSEESHHRKSIAFVLFLFFERYQHSSSGEKCGKQGKRVDFYFLKRANICFE